MLSLRYWLALIGLIGLVGCATPGSTTSEAAPTVQPIPMVCLVFGPGGEHENATDYSRCLAAPDAWYEANAILTSIAAATARAEQLLPPTATPSPTATPQLIACGVIGVDGGVIYDVARNVAGSYPWGGITPSGVYIGIFNGVMSVFEEGNELPYVQNGDSICFSRNRDALQHHVPSR